MNEYDLARRLRGASASRSLEIGEVVGLEPMVVKIGASEYKCNKSGVDGWKFYELITDNKELELKELELETVALTGASVNCGYGSVSAVNATKGTAVKAKAKEGKAFIRYEVGDKLCVQQLSGDSAFMILGKIREVE